jgi:hypothetical protein
MMDKIGGNRIDIFFWDILSSYHMMRFLFLGPLFPMGFLAVDVLQISKLCWEIVCLSGQFNPVGVNLCVESPLKLTS